MEALGIVGMSLGSAGFTFALMALARISDLEERLKEAGVLETSARSDPKTDP